MLNGGLGNDEYQFNFTGTATVVEEGGVDLIWFTNHTFAQLSYAQVGDDLEFYASGSGEKIVVQDFFLGGDHKVEYLFDSTLAGIDISGWA